MFIIEFVEPYFDYIRSRYWTSKYEFIIYSIVVNIKYR